MKLEKFKERNNKQKSMIIFTIACILLIAGVFLYKTFASFQVIENEDLINGNISDPGDVYFAFYIDGELSKTMPSKESNYVFNSKKSYCGELGKKDENIIPWYHREDGSITVEGILTTHTKCNLYFENGENLINKIKNITPKEEDSGEEGLYKVNHDDADITYTEEKEKQDLLKQEEYRYAGSDPDNYIWFNHELWRIIGLVNTPEGQRIKLIRKDSIGSYAWDTSEKEINQGYGVNEWSTSDIQVLLNDYYFQNKINQTCYIVLQNQSISCSFDGKDDHVRGLKQVAEMIDTITWNTGAIINYVFPSLYSQERGNLVNICSDSNDCNDKISRSYLWRGNVGLIYPSDFAYGIGKNRQTCLNVDFTSWRDNTECQNNNWQAASASYWTISPLQNVTKDYLVVSIANGYYMGSSYTSVTEPRPVYPTLYLKTDILVSQNSTGKIENPYMI